MTFERMTKYESVGGHAHAVPTVDADTAMMRLAAYEDTGLRPEDIAEYKKFEDWLVKNNTPLSHVLELLAAERDVSGICEVRTYKHYPRRGVPIYCTQSKRACLDFEERGGRDIRYMGEERRT